MNDLSQGLVVIRPRVGLNPQDLAIWLEGNFQVPGSHDAGPRAKEEVLIRGGNPLVNATVRVVEDV